jgi:hypothetical protein
VATFPALTVGTVYSNLKLNATSTGLTSALSNTFNVTPPAAPVAGEPVSFALDGEDVWGPVTFTVDFGDGDSASARTTTRTAIHVFARATNTSTIQHTYAQPGDYTSTITLTDGGANTVTTTRPVAVASAPVAQPPQASPPLPPVAGLPDPILGQTVNLATVRPVVLVKEPGSKIFVPLVEPRQVRVGSIIDTRKGRVRMTIANGRGGLDTADFYEGVFKITQKATGSKFATLLLFGGGFKGCPKAPKAQLARKKPLLKRSVRHLWGSGAGRFRTVGRYSAASVRGTTWLTDDKCNGTLTRVTQGAVAVRDFVKRKTIVVRAPKSYFAGPRRRR